MESTKEIIEFVLKETKNLGADQADVYLTQSTVTRVKVRLGKIEELRQSTPKALGLRIFKNKRKALTFTGDLRPQTLKKLIKKTFEIVEVSTQDDYNGLPDEKLLGIAPDDLNLFDPYIPQISTDQKIKIASELEKLGLDADPLIKNSEGATWSDTYGEAVLANSLGFYGSQKFSSCSISLGLLAEKDNVKQSDGWYSVSRHFSKLESIESVAQKAVKRTISKIGAQKPKTATLPVIFDPDVGRDLLNILGNAILGSSIYRKSSFLVGMLNNQIAVKDFILIDDSLLPSGLGSRNFDDEGLPGRKNVLIENGILKSYLCDIYFSRKLNHPPTGSASRSPSSDPSPGLSNLYLLPGKYTPEEIIHSVKEGVYVTSVHWVGVNYVTGDYSRGAEGFWIENGNITYPIQEFTIASNIKTMLQSIEMIGNDLEFRSTVNCPTLKIASMAISGK